MRDPYELLGVRRDASADEIKAAFRRAAMRHHPDRNPDDPSAQGRFAELNRAYQILSNPGQRQNYDRFGAAAFERQVGAEGPGFSDYIDFSQVDGVMADVLSAIGLKPGQRRPLQYQLSLSFEEAALGCHKEIKFARLDYCKTCAGSGAAASTKLSPCRQCGGAGKVKLSKALSALPLERRCPACYGRGKLPEAPCDTCHGQGLTKQTITQALDLPPGLEPGAAHVVKQQGDRQRETGAFADLEVQISVEPHPYFERDGQHIRCRVPVSFIQATLGGEIQVRTLSGQAKVRVPKATQSGTVLRLKGQGVPQRLLGRGDQLVEVFVEVPQEVTPRIHELLVQLGQELGEPLSVDTAPGAGDAPRGFVEKLRGLF